MPVPLGSAVVPADLPEHSEGAGLHPSPGTLSPTPAPPVWSLAHSPGHREPPAPPSTRQSGPEGQWSSRTRHQAGCKGGQWVGWRLPGPHSQPAGASSGQAGAGLLGTPPQHILDGPLDTHRLPEGPFPAAWHTPGWAPRVPHQGCSQHLHTGDAAWVGHLGTASPGQP